MRQTSRKSPFGLALALISGLLIVSEGASAAVLVQDTAGTIQATGYFGQSVTTPSGGPFTNVTFNFYDYEDAPIAPVGNLFLLSQEYVGGLFGLNASTPGFVAETTTTTGSQYIFPSTLTLDSDQRYFFYYQPGGTIDILVGNSTYAGGNLYFSRFSGGSYDSFPNEDADFSLSGTTVVPEPTSLAIVSVGLFGLAVLRHRSKGTMPRRSQYPARRRNAEQTESDRITNMHG